MRNQMVFSVGFIVGTMFWAFVNWWLTERKISIAPCLSLRKLGNVKSSDYVVLGDGTSKKLGMIRLNEDHIATLNSELTRENSRLNSLVADLQKCHAEDLENLQRVGQAFTIASKKLQKIRDFANE